MPEYLAPGVYVEERAFRQKDDRGGEHEYGARSWDPPGSVLCLVSRSSSPATSTSSEPTAASNR